MKKNGRGGLIIKTEVGARWSHDIRYTKGSLGRYDGSPDKGTKRAK